MYVTDPTPTPHAHLQSVGERHPGQVPKGQHEPKTVGSDVHSGQNRPLLVHRIPDVDALADGRHACTCSVRYVRTNTLFFCVHTKT